MIIIYYTWGIKGLDCRVPACQQSLAKDYIASRSYIIYKILGLATNLLATSFNFYSTHNGRSKMAVHGNLELHRWDTVNDCETRLCPTCSATDSRADQLAVDPASGRPNDGRHCDISRNALRLYRASTF